MIIIERHGCVLSWNLFSLNLNYVIITLQTVCIQRCSSVPTHSDVKLDVNSCSACQWFIHAADCTRCVHTCNRVPLILASISHKLAMWLSPNFFLFIQKNNFCSHFILSVYMPTSMLCNHIVWIFYLNLAILYKAAK